MKPILFVEHVSWEGPHRLAEPLARELPTLSVNALEGETLPSPESLAGAVFMGGPMNVDETEHLPDLLTELRWIERALWNELPLLGVCLGSQLIARALGAPVTRAAEPELGWHPIDVHVPDDPILGSLAPATTVLHWHADTFATPPGAVRLASSERTSCQAFRFVNAWGLLFHPEADGSLVRAWLDEPAMAEEAEAVLGDDARRVLLADAARHERDLQDRSKIGFDSFARLVQDHATAGSQGFGVDTRSVAGAAGSDGGRRGTNDG